MLPKLLIIIAGVALIGSGLLGVRRMQLEARHSVSRLHVNIDDLRRATWDLQARIEQETRPGLLNQRLQHVPDRFEPVRLSGG